ncbi:glycosyltransferase [Egicoccus halophilus]|uniref:Glycosyl transferase n=1 Tax=Egicoccus halophilus TaxID=1670830 RepID=A0A8J3EY20_9ACTN|nr:glycosyltransferase [Egicoccus halophilus]GGI06973.1 glycosyl transferase [Egicoccus halophilus]
MAPSVALAHDYLTQRGGAERVALELTRAFPGAPMYTSLYVPEATFPGFADVDVRPSWLNQVRPLRQRHRLALPFYAPAVGSLRPREDVLFVSSSGWAHLVPTEGRKIVYCHNPPRWLYQSDEYLAGHRLARAGLEATLWPRLRRLDRRSAAEADVYLANSHNVARRIRQRYRREVHAVIHPPVSADLLAASPSDVGLPRAVREAEPFVLVVSRLLPYKNVEFVLAAAEATPERTFVVVGDGPLRELMVRRAPANVRWLRSVTDAQLAWLYAAAGCLLAASFEDLGLTPPEAASFGTPTLALRAGGYLETVVEGASGWFFDALDVREMQAGLRELDRLALPADDVRRHAEPFAPATFRTAVTDLLAAVV